MGKTLYLDCFSGISGDMFLGALVDLGVSVEAVRAELAALPVHGYRIETGKTTVAGIVGTAFRVRLDEGHVHSHGHDHGAPDHDHAHAHAPDHDHAHGRTYAEISAMLDAAPLSPKVREGAQAVFLEIAKAESAVHGEPLAEIHFHEVGAVDSIVDIVGGLAALNLLGVDRIVCSPLSDGSGTISSRHGVIPVPVPAVMKMLEGTRIPYRTGTADTELVTPTGMGIAKVLSSSFGPMPAMCVDRIGFGFGTRDIGRLNALRVFLGEDLPEAQPVPVFGLPGFTDRAVVLECQIDDSTPETLGYAAERLMVEGALDVAFVPAFMKKWRPAVLATVVCRPADESRMVRILFAETGTIGVRRRETDRHVMARTTTTLDTESGPVRVKHAVWGDVRKASPEYEDLKSYAARAGIPLQEAARRLAARIGETPVEPDGGARP
jgi:uncharacterized protein (TIGR00299 family) protein